MNWVRIIVVTCYVIIIVTTKSNISSVANTKVSVAIIIDRRIAGVCYLYLVVTGLIVTGWYTPAVTPIIRSAAGYGFIEGKQTGCVSILEDWFLAYSK